MQTSCSASWQGALVLEAWLIPAEEGVYGVSQSWRSCPVWMHTRQLCLDPCAGSLCSSVCLGLGGLQTLTVALLSHTLPRHIFILVPIVVPAFKHFLWHHWYTTQIIKSFFYTGHMQLIDLISEVQSWTNVCTQFSSPWALEHVLGFGWFCSSSTFPHLYPSAPA